jgi:signal transduction histidine kinase
MRYISHEIRSPLSVALQGLDLIVSKIGKNPNMGIGGGGGVSGLGGGGVGGVGVGGGGGGGGIGGISIGEGGIGGIGSIGGGYTGWESEELREVLEITQDCRESCEVASATLNDLLLFDKLRANMVEIVKEPHLSTTFIQVTICIILYVIVLTPSLSCMSYVICHMSYVMQLCIKPSPFMVQLCIKPTSAY